MPLDIEDLKYNRLEDLVFAARGFNALSKLAHKRTADGRTFLQVFADKCAENPRHFDTMVTVVVNGLKNEKL